MSKPPATIIAFPFRMRTFGELETVFTDVMTLVEDAATVLERRNGCMEDLKTAQHAMKFTLRAIECGGVCLAMRSYALGEPVNTDLLILKPVIEVSPLSGDPELDALSIRLNRLWPQVDAMGRVFAAMAAESKTENDTNSHLGGTSA